MARIHAGEIEILLRVYRDDDIPESIPNIGYLKTLVRFGLIIDRRVGYSITEKGKEIVKQFEKITFDV